MVRDEAWVASLGESWANVPKSTGLRYILEAMSDDLTADILKAEIPVLFIAAIPEKTLTYGSTEFLRHQWGTAIPEGSGVKLVYFKDTRHLVPLDAPAKFDETIAKFLASPKQGK